MTRENLRRLVDELPDEELVEASRLLEFLRDRPRTNAKEIPVAVEAGHTYRMVTPRMVNPGGGRPVAADLEDQDEVTSTQSSQETDIDDG